MNRDDEVGDSVPSGEPRANPYGPADVEAILVERGWLDVSLRSEAAQEWITLAARLLGPHVADRAALGELVSLCFEYDAAKHFKRGRDAHGAGARRRPRSDPRIGNGNDCDGACGFRPVPRDCGGGQSPRRRIEVDCFFIRSGWR